MNTKSKKPFLWRSVLYIALGIVATTVSQAFFLVPNKIVPGGLVGVGTIAYDQVGIPIGLFTILGNIFLVALQARAMGWGSSGKTIACVLLQGVFLDTLVTVMKVRPWATDPMLACIYGGLISGAGSALIFRGGGTLGGTDILGQLLLKYKHVPIGTTFLWSDIVVLGMAAVFYGPNLALFALIKSYIFSKTVDTFMEGFSVYRQVLIVSGQADTIAWGIIEEMHRGVTMLGGRGAYTSKPVEVILTAVRRREVPDLEELVYRLDPMAFIIVTDARRVLGKGFENLERVVQEVKGTVGEQTS